MNLDILTDEPLHKQFLITYAEADIQSCIEKEAVDMQPSVKVDGFRPGKVPVEYIIRVYGAKIRIDAMNKKVSEDIGRLVANNNYHLAATPIYKFRERQDIDDTNYYLEVDFMLMPDVDVDFDAIELNEYRLNEDAFEEMVDKNLLFLQILTSDFLEKEKEPAALNNRVQLSIDVAINGEATPGLSKEISVLLGHDQLPAEIEKNVLGMRLNEEKIFDHFYPEDTKNPFFDGILGKTVTFTVKALKVEEPQIKELTEESMASFGFKSAEELIENMRKNTENILKTQADKKIKADLLDYIKKNIKIDLSEVLVRQEANEMAFNEASRLYDTDAMEEVLAGLRQVSPTEAHLEKARNNLTISLTFSNYARKNDIKIDDSELKNEMEFYLDELKRLNKVRPNQKEKNYNEFATRVHMIVFERKVTTAMLTRIKTNLVKLSKEEFFDTLDIN